MTRATAAPPGAADPGAAPPNDTGIAAGAARAKAATVARHAPWVLVLVAAALFLASATYGIQAPFYYGHYGYHGGSYATWSRGTVRHHTLFPVNEPGFAPPRPGTYYIHHPVLTPQLVTLTFAVFGEHEWSVRLAGLLGSSLCFVLLTALAWRRLGPYAGATAALVFAVVPVNIWYSVNIDPGFPSIACLLAFFLFYARWLETGRWRLGIAALGAEALAGGFEWSPYFAFVVIFVHVAHTGLRRRGRFLAFAFLHPLVVIVPLLTHFFLVWRIGMIEDLRGAYRNRAAEVSYSQFLKVMTEYGQTMFGRALLVVMVLWCVLTVARVVRGRGRAVDLVGLTFAIALIVYVHVFKVAVITHAYRLLYGNVWAAWAAADLTARAGRFTEKLLASRLRRHAAAISINRAVAGLTALVIIAVTAPVAWAGLIESRLHGGIPGWKTFNPDLRQTAFSQEVNRLTRPGDVLYFHPTYANPPPGRMDWAFYFDRDLRRGSTLRLLQGLPPAQQKRAVALLSLPALGIDELRLFGDLARRHPVVHVQDLVMLDLRTDRSDLQAYSITPPVDRGAGSGAIRRWLVGPYPQPRLIPDAAQRNADQQLIQSTLALVPRAAVPPGPPVAAKATPLPVKKLPAPLRRPRQSKTQHPR
ncbi:MAG: glycosyltransferase family 39 protein [Verrucomicrobiota bacterium]